MITAKAERRSKGSFEDVIERLEQAVQGPQTVKVGYIAGEADQAILNRAVWNEFGTSRGIPERPFFRNAMSENQPSYRSYLRSSARKILAGEQDMRRTLNRLGLLAQGHVKESIIALDAPPNSPATIKRKGSSNPLFDTGAMSQSVTYQVE